MGGEGNFLIRREWIYPADVSGPFRRWRKVVGWLLIGFLVVLPWIPVNGHPAVRIDIPGRELVLLGAIFTPHDAWALALMAIIAAVLLFFMASVFGRVWCGWACPQTVWLDRVYRPLETLIEGKSNKRRKMDSKGWRNWPRGWWLRKIGKHAAFLVVTILTVGVVMTWFLGGPELLRGEIGGKGAGIYAFLVFLFYLDAAWFREQLCEYACPYARFQGALMSEKSLVVAYDAQRGEPRVKGKDRDGGDCISCNRCVQVCPSGIDIRDGDQLQCIACASCIDACDEVMIKIGKPTGLIRYTTDRDATGVRSVSLATLGRRSFVYMGLIGLLLFGLVGGMVRRSDTRIAIARAVAGEIFRELPDGRIANQLTIHINNRAQAPHSFTVTTPTEGVEMTVPGSPWTVEWGDEERLHAFVVAAPGAFEDGRLPITVRVERDDGEAVDETFTLLGPES